MACYHIITKLRKAIGWKQIWNIGENTIALHDEGKITGAKGLLAGLMTWK